MTACALPKETIFHQTALRTDTINVHQPDTNSMLPVIKSNTSYTVCSVHTDGQGKGNSKAAGSDYWQYYIWTKLGKLSDSKTHS